VNNCNSLWWRLLLKWHWKWIRRRLQQRGLDLDESIFAHILIIGTSAQMPWMMMLLSLITSRILSIKSRSIEAFIFAILVKTIKSTERILECFIYKRDSYTFLLRLSQELHKRLQSTLFPSLNEINKIEKEIY